MDNINSTKFKIKLEVAINSCIENGRRLLEDSEDLQDSNRFPSAKALAILAQEEFAKAYIIKLVYEGAIPWCKEIIRAIKDHRCKHLIAILMEYLFTPWDELTERRKKIKENGFKVHLPKKVIDVLNIFCHEKISRWKFPDWMWDEDYAYDAETKKVWLGKVDKDKQNALYVDVNKDAGVANMPQSSDDEVNKQREYAQVLEDVASGHDCFAFTEKQYIKSILKEIFDSIYRSDG